MLWKLTGPRAIGVSRRAIADSFEHHRHCLPLPLLRQLLARPFVFLSSAAPASSPQRLQKHRACDCAAMADGAAPPKPKRSFFKKPSWKQNADTGDDDDPTAMFDGSKQTFSAIMEERERARVKKLQEQEESARKRELDAARRGKRRKTAHDEEHPPVRRDEGQR